MFQFSVTIFSDDDFTLLGPGVYYPPGADNVHHIITSSSIKELQKESVFWLLSLTVLPPWCKDIDKYDEHASGYGYDVAFRSVIYEAAHAVAVGRTSFYYGGNRTIEWHIT